MEGDKKRSAASWFAWAFSLVLLATVAVVSIELVRHPKRSIPSVIVGTNDQVYYSHAATMQEATSLGHALESTGFFNGRGSSVMLTKNKGVTTVSFVVNDGVWDRPESIASFEEIGRRIAGAAGGFPIHVHLVDAGWTVHKSVVVGKVTVGAKDVIYYLDSATENDAKALGQALRDAGYLQDLGVSVVISKGDAPWIGFVVGDGVWNRQDAAVGFENLARKVAPSIGPLPLQLRLLDAQMELRKQIEIR